MEPTYTAPMESAYVLQPSSFGPANVSLVHLRAGTAHYKRRGTLLATTNETLGGSDLQAA